MVLYSFSLSLPVDSRHEPHRLVTTRRQGVPNPANIMLPAQKLATHISTSVTLVCVCLLRSAAHSVALPNTTKWHSLPRSSTLFEGKGSETNRLALDTKIASQSSVPSADGPGPAQGCFIYTNLGDSFEHQSYVWDSLSQTRLFNPYIAIYLISTSKAFAEAGVQERMDALRITAIDYASLAHVALNKFRDAFFVQGDMSPGGNNKFTQYTSERLLAVFVLMKTFNLVNVFHVENDNLVYFRAVALLQAMDMCEVQLAVPFPAIRVAVVGCAYIRHAEALLPFVEFATNVFMMGRDKAIEYLGTEWINDMTLLGMFYKENSLSNNVSELPSRVYTSRHQYSSEESSEEYFLRPVAFQEGQPFSCIAEAIPDSIFDSCVIGQYFGGTYHKPGEAFWQEDRQLDPRGKTLWWRQVSLYGTEVRIPFIDNMRIHNLHVHSKQLPKFMSVV